MNIPFKTLAPLFMPLVDKALGEHPTRFDMHVGMGIYTHCGPFDSDTFQRFLKCWDHMTQSAHPEYEQMTLRIYPDYKGEFDPQVSLRFNVCIDCLRSAFKNYGRPEWSFIFQDMKHAEISTQDNPT